MVVASDELAADRRSASRRHARPPATRVLVVEDEPVPRQLLHAFLTRHGFDVLEASNGEEGLQRLREATPDLILLDLNMPVMDGWAFRAAQRRLDEDLATTPIVVMTGSDGAQAHAASLSAAGLIEKPFNPDRLLGAIEAALRH